MDTAYWLQHIDWQSNFLRVVLNFNKDPSSKTLRPLIELYGRDRDRMKLEVEILERQLKHRLTHFAKPNDATVRKVIIKNEKRVLAIHLHVRSGYGGAALARFFKVPRSTAYGWLEWFESLPEGVQAGILEFLDTLEKAARKMPPIYEFLPASRRRDQTRGFGCGREGPERTDLRVPAEPRGHRAREAGLGSAVVGTWAGVEGVSR